MSATSILVGLFACSSSGGGDGSGSSSGAIGDDGGSSSSGSTTSSGGSSGTTSGEIDAASLPKDPCGTTPVDFTGGPKNKPGGVIRGVIRLPEASDFVQLVVHYGLPKQTTNTSLDYLFGNGSHGPAEGGPAKTEFTFEIRGIDLVAEPTAVWLHAMDDRNGDERFSDPADWAGFYPGMTTNPAPPWAAVGIELSLSNPAKCDVDFGIGPAVCLKPWGDSCNNANECRTTACVCNDDTTSRANGFCGSLATPKVCVSGENFCKCDTHGGVKSFEMGNCFGGPLY